MDANELRAAFTRFFTDRGHTAVPSASLIPHDPSVLFTIAGMVPFKPYFVGDEPAPWPRATSVQKCFRTLDIEIVGTDTYHCTFFEMLGNFSFGDYFKEEAIPMAWELLTEVFGLDGDRLWVTVHDERRRGRADLDRQGGLPGRADPAHGRRGQLLGHGRHRPLRSGLGDLHRQGRRLRRRTAAPSSAARTASSRCGTWSSCSTTGRPTAPGPTCPKKNIDTGAGLERILPILQGHDSVFDTDLFAPIIEAAAATSAPPTAATSKTDVALRLMADHGRAMSMLVADGVLPANEGRGYVLRRVVRRAVLAARRLGVDTPVTPVLVEAATEVLGGAWPALVENHDMILSVLDREEAGFDRTLRAGLGRLEEAFATGDKVLGGDVAFTLHDTHGFPVELTEELARDAGVEVDRAGFDAAMAEQRSRARRRRGRPRWGTSRPTAACLESEGTDELRRA